MKCLANNCHILELLKAIIKEKHVLLAKCIVFEEIYVNCLWRRLLYISFISPNCSTKSLFFDWLVFFYLIIPLITN